MTTIIQRNYEVPLDRHDEFELLCSERRSLNLQSQGMPMVGYGSWTFNASEHLAALFAFRSLTNWCRPSHQEPALSPPEEMVGDCQQRASLIQCHWRSLLTVATDCGRPV